MGLTTATFPAYMAERVEAAFGLSIDALLDAFESVLAGLSKADTAIRDFDWAVYWYANPADAWWEQ